MSAIEASRILVGFAALIFVLEDWSLRPTLVRERPWRVQRADFPLPRAFDLLFSDRVLGPLLALRAAAGVGLLVSPHVFDVVVLAFGTWWWAVRWRGTFNGASDTMTMVVLAGVGLFLWNPDLAHAAHVVIGVNLVGSFVVAGLAKLGARGWRTGEVPAAFAAEVGLKLPCPRACAAAVLAFETSFPLAIANASLTPVYVALGLTFHVANAWAFGLNRFLLAWAAAYPALFALVET